MKEKGRRLNVSGKENALGEGRRGRSRFSLATYLPTYPPTFLSLYLPNRPTANLTIENESKKITSRSLRARRCAARCIATSRWSRDTPRSTKATTWCVERCDQSGAAAPARPRMLVQVRARSGGLVRARPFPWLAAAAELEPFAAAVIHSPGQFVERSSLYAGGRVRECRCVIT